MTKHRILRKAIASVAGCALLLSSAAQSIQACTGVTLKAKDGAVVFGRPSNGDRSISSRGWSLSRAGTSSRLTRLMANRDDPGRENLEWSGLMRSKRTWSSRE